MRVDGWLLAGLLLIFLCLVGCAGALSGAKKSANVAGSIAIAAHQELPIVCRFAEENARTLEQANEVIVACAKAEDAYGVFRQAWLTLAAAIHAAELSGTAPANLPELVSAVETAAAHFTQAFEYVKRLAQ